MIWSVSTFSAGSGITALVNVRNGSAIGWSSATANGGKQLDAGERPRVGDLAADCPRGRRDWRGEGRTRHLALAPLEVPVRGADRVLAGRELVAVHRDAHRAAGLAPLGAGGPEDLVQALPLRLP